MARLYQWTADDEVQGPRLDDGGARREYCRDDDTDRPPGAGRGRRPLLPGKRDPGLTSVRPLVLGLDGGNTKTVAIVAGLDGTVLGTGRSGCGDIHGVPLEAALGELAAAIDGAVHEAGGSRDDVVAAGCSLAGADWPEDFTLLEAEMRQCLPSATE